ncbi:serine/threonine-protein kinase [Streptomyces sp. NBC_01754]|uniref:serine/threonine-protein kinase n=1 Tax=Streptomyces sp. NBC_01754 TaxID=2975930 RepID=UPI002DDBF58C|nr:serine/threonine-protein kinase [Streptomyces sp. NBC_01754]WSC93382.1 serine/threonine-protein kinase [Streptomyces sp. NBC_01754]
MQGEDRAGAGGGSDGPWAGSTPQQAGSGAAQQWSAAPSHGASSTPDTPHAVIEGRYELLEPIGSGGMGEVWKAHDRRLRRLVAVKGLLDRNAVAAGSQAAAMQRARREAEAIAKIEHPNVVTVHDQVETDNQVWIVMKLLDAGSLADLLHGQGVLAVPRAADIAHQILQGLRAVHAASVLHRDVKPGNVLVRDDGHVVLVDFGIATFEGATPLTLSGSVIGTPPYQAPELFFSGPTPASDLWALGVTLYEMVEGGLPFGGRESWEVQASIQQSPHPVLRYAGLLTPVIQGLLRTNPDERLDTSTADSMLREVLGAPSDAAPAGAAKQPPEHEPEPVPAREPTPEPPFAPAPPIAPKGLRSGFRKGATRAVSVALAIALLTTAGWLVASRTGSGGKDEDKAGGAAGPGGRGDDAETQTWEEWKKAHPQLKIGVKADQPGLSLKKEKNSEDSPTYAGFDIDMAYKVGRHLGYEDKDVAFVDVTSENRKSHLTSKAVDLVIASYTMQKAAGIEFVGPYYEAGRGFLVRKDSVRHGEIKDSSYLIAKKVEVCTAEGSTYARDLPRLGFTLSKSPAKSYRYCLEQLLSKETDVYAVASDDAVLAGYAQSDTVRMLDPIEGTEKYGVAVRSGTQALKKKVCSAVAAVLEDTSGWNSMFQKNLAPLLKKPTPGVPDLDPKACPES